MKSLYPASIHSCLNNRRTLSQNTWIQPESELSHQTSPFKNLTILNVRIHASYIGDQQAQTFLQVPILWRLKI